MLATVLAFVRRDFQIAKSSRFAFVLEVASAAFSVITFALVARLVPQDQVPGGYFTFATIGMAMSAFLQTGAVVVATNLRQDQVLGTLETILSSGWGVSVLASAMCAYPFLAAAIRAVVYLGLAFVFGASAPQANWGLGLLAMALGSVSFAGLALVATALVLLVRQAVTATGWLIAVLTLAAGVLFPPRLLPGWARWLADLSPFTHTLALARRAILEGAGWAAGVGELALLVAMAAVFAALGVGSMVGGLAWSRRSGNLAQY